MEVVSVRVADIRPEYDNLKEWMADDANLYIGRKRVVFVENEAGEKIRWPPVDSVFANHFIIGKDGNREEVIKKYRSSMRKMIKNGQISLELLDGKRRLGCWCKPDSCHGDVLLELYYKYR